MLGSPGRVRNLFPEAPSAQPMSAQPGTCPGEQALPSWLAFHIPGTSSQGMEAREH